MEYSTKDVITWIFTHPKIKSSFNNYIYICHSRIGVPEKSEKSDFIEAINILKQIASIDNPRVCSGLFSNANTLFIKSRMAQHDEPKLLSYIGQMFCNHWTGQDILNSQLQQEISLLEFEGSFWNRHGDKIITAGGVALTGLGMFFGLTPGQAAGISSKETKDIMKSHYGELEKAKRAFNELRNAILSIRF